MTDWYAIRTATRREYDANAELYEAGFPFYVPSDTHDRKLKGEVEVIVKPRFPGYGFVQCDANQLSEVVKTQFVHDFLRYIDRHGDLRPLPVPAWVVAQLFEQQWAGRFDRRTAEYIPARGDKVKLSTGMWAATGYVFEVTSVSSDKRRAVLSHRGWRLEEDTAHLVAA